MKIITPISACIVLLASLSCETKNNSQNTDPKKQEIQTTEKIQFEEVQRYFVKNSEMPTTITTKKISSKEEFDRTFSPAAVMGKNGKPDNIDFEKYIVLAVYAPATNQKTDIKADRLEYGNKTLTLYYKISNGQEQTFSTKPLLLLKINKKYDGFTKFVKE